jgi:hypothetical protein
MVSAESGVAAEAADAGAVVAPGVMPMATGLRAVKAVRTQVSPVDPVLPTAIVRSTLALPRATE